MQDIHQMDELSLYVAHPLSIHFPNLIFILYYLDASEPFKAVAAANADFLTSLKPFVGERNVSLENMYNVFDYMNVNYIHDATFRASVTEQQMVSPLFLTLCRDAQRLVSTVGTSASSGQLSRTGCLFLPAERRHREYCRPDDDSRDSGSHGKDHFANGAISVAVLW